jgi:hypothetical protein
MGSVHQEAVTTVLVLAVIATARYIATDFASAVLCNLQVERSITRPPLSAYAVHAIRLIDLHSRPDLTRECTWHKDWRALRQ